MRAIADFLAEPELETLSLEDAAELAASAAVELGAQKLGAVQVGATWAAMYSNGWSAHAHLRTVVGEPTWEGVIAAGIHGGALIVDADLIEFIDGVRSGDPEKVKTTQASSSHQGLQWGPVSDSWGEPGEWDYAQGSGDIFLRAATRGRFLNSIAKLDFAPFATQENARLTLQGVLDDNGWRWFEYPGRSLFSLPSGKTGAILDRASLELEPDSWKLVCLRISCASRETRTLHSLIAIVAAT